MFSSPQQQVRRRFLTACKAVYGEGFEKGYLNGDVVFDLNESADAAMDRINEYLDDWCNLERELRVSSLLTEV